jgi:hypothetical protein
MKKALFIFLLGAAAGGAGGFFGHAKFGAGIPQLRGAPTEATVVSMRREDDRLLMTLETPDAVVLATFTRRADNLESIIHEGSHLTVRLPGDRPLVDDPPIVRVHSAEPAGEPAEGAQPEGDPEGEHEAEATEEHPEEPAAGETGPVSAAPSPRSRHRT